MPAQNRNRPTSYHSPLRTRQAAETRRAVIAAATRLFSERGWASTTLAAIAAEAGTAIETIYSGFASKMGLLLAAIDVAIVGDDDNTPVEARPEFADLGSGTQAERLEAAARIITAALVRAQPLMKPLREAAASDATARERLDAYEATRRTTVGAGLALLLGYAPPDRLVDTMWAIASPEVFVKLTEERGWSVEGYQSWLLITAGALLERVEQ
jgi:AcrR family transcriptional regulator